MDALLRSIMMQEAIHSAKLEGATVTPETIEAATRYVAGDYDSDELVRLTQQRHAKGKEPSHE